MSFISKLITVILFGIVGYFEGNFLAKFYPYDDPFDISRYIIILILIVINLAVAVFFINYEIMRKKVNEIKKDLDEIKKEILKDKKEANLNAESDSSKSTSFSSGTENELNKVEKALEKENN